MFGGYLSQQNDVCLIDVDAEKVNRINREGITILEPEGSANITPGLPQAQKAWA